MANKRFGLGMLVITLVFGMSVVGCASSPLTKRFFSNEPVQVISEINAESTRVSELTNIVWLGAFGSRTFPSIAETARAGGITRIATVEYYVRPGILRLWREFTTIVTGD
ncbi:MAG: TRL-like family protein [Treponema sp.]|nr:TRL-like family protein [Treponema sp.]